MPNTHESADTKFTAQEIKELERSGSISDIEGYSRVDARIVGCLLETLGITRIPNERQLRLIGENTIQMTLGVDRE